MKTAILVTILAGLVTAPPPTAGPSKTSKADAHLYSLPDVMRVFPDTDEQSENPAKAGLNANCYRWLEGDEDNAPRILNQMWKQVYELTAAARYALSEEGYKDEENRRLATRYFGIVPDVVTSKKGLFGLGKDVTNTEFRPTKGVQLEKLEHAKGWYKDIHAFMEKPKPEAEQPWIFCDSDFTRWEGKYSPHYDTRRRIVKTPMRTDQTLIQWLTRWYRTPFDDNHFWFYMEEPHSTYFSVDGADSYRHPRVGIMPFQPDRKGRSHFCNSRTTDGRLFSAELNKNDPQYLPTPVMVICMHIFRDNHLLDELPVTEQREGKYLQGLDTRSRTLFHEMIHLVADGWSTTSNSPDARVYRSKCPRDSNNKCLAEPPKGWHLQKSNYEKLDDQASGGMESLYITLHDSAEPQGRRFSIYDYPGNFSPENYVWFAITAYLHKNSPKDFWSTGVCKKKAETLAESLAPPAGHWGRVP